MARLNESSSKTRTAFTLVELLVVIGIIALLVSILLPALNKARHAATLIKCAAQLRQVGMACVQYRQDNKTYEVPFERYPRSSWTVTGGNNAKGSYNATTAERYDKRWFNYLYGYTKTYAIFNCPTTTFDGGLSTVPGTSTMVKGVEGDGSPDWVQPGFSGVGQTCNYTYCASTASRAEFPSPNYPTNGTPTAVELVANSPRKYSQTKGIARMGGVEYHKLIQVMDGVYWVNDVSYAPAFSSSLWNGSRFSHQGPAVYVSSIGAKISGKSNALFFDGHVEVVTPATIAQRTVTLPTSGGNAYVSLFYAK